MPICDTCGNDYDKAFTVTWGDDNSATSITTSTRGSSSAPAFASRNVVRPMSNHRGIELDLDDGLDAGLAQ